MAENTASSSTPKNTEAKPAAAAPAAKPAAAPAPAAKPAAAKPAPNPRPKAPKPGTPSPNLKRPGVVYGGIKALKTPNVVVVHTHTVTGSDSLESLAQEYFGDRSKVGEIRKANPDLADNAQPEAGQAIKIPKG